ncbi:CusA/CzcA family heavy metal efflux RND transporter [Idiomarina sp. OT37-5b]|jgi:Cu(I)/Ag(I) efflux system membrane protein CusA/SilA|uniref:efflux RND transporter permease subunit n=1 Tax=Idiomarina sp. OT37-5b TaxID=2100422 RepID=UPI000CF93AA8|nr:CusA/CzcA family heavy metal efflux RND transporter [Idiomarina sp. OT37-5b]AVJ55157.1 CusA/CzcA family heavy metal efflux RND transporter [Idiomarina sp. OT37-5b]
MLTRIIQASLRNSMLVLLLFAALSFLAWKSLQQTKLDAIPDLSDVQVIVKTSYPGQAPAVVEEQVTYPLSSVMLSVPNTKSVRGFSFFGDSYVYVIFEEGTDPYWARSRVIEYLDQAQSQLPEAVQPSLGPDATGVGWIYQYALVDHSGQHNLGELTRLQNWFLQQELQSVEGVAEVARVGGMVETYQVVVDPRTLHQYQLSLTDVEQAIQQANSEVGGSVVEMAEAEYMVRGLGYLQSIEDLRQLPLLKASGNDGVLLLEDIADVRLGPQVRRGVAELDGDGEVVGGIVVMRYGANALQTIDNVKAKLEQLQQGLPEGVELVTTYDRSELIQASVDNLTTKLIEEMALVAIVCVLFLWHARSALVAVVSLPLSVLLAIWIMNGLGISANIMSLGGIAIAIGALVDAAIVMIENAHKHLHHYQQQNDDKPAQGAQRWRLITDACSEVGPSLFFSLLVITVSFIPVFALQGQQGRLFEPLAYTKTLAMGAASVLAVTLIPVLIALLVRGKIPAETGNPLTRLLIWLYRPLLNMTLRWPKLLIVLCIGITASAWYPWQKLDYELMPPLYEGDLMYMPTTLPGISVNEASELLQQTDALIAQHPQVKRVFGKIGRADTATDPAPLTMIETSITLTPEEQWPAGKTIDDVMDELDAMVQIPGLTNAWVMPIRTRIEMLATGVKTPLAIKVSGAEFARIQKLATDIEGVLAELPETGSVIAERAADGRYIEVLPKLREAARFGLSQADIQQHLMQAVGGSNIATSVQGNERFPINLRYPRETRDHIDKLRELPIRSADGRWLTLSDVAEIDLTSGPAVLKSENARLSSWIFIEPAKGVTVSDYIAAVSDELAQLSLPTGYSWSWTGQFESMQQVEADLKEIIPLTLALIVILLYLTFRSMGQALLVIATLPLALTGSLWLLYWLDYNLSLAVIVGMIALAGVAAEFGVVMLLYLNNAWKGVGQQRPQLQAAIEEGAVLRVRPKAMTVATIVIGLLPIMLGSGIGNEVMQRIAAPMVGGMILAPLVSMLLIPAVFYLRWK